MREIIMPRSIPLAAILLELFPIVTLSCFYFFICNDSGSTNAIEMKLHIWIGLKQGKSHAQDPKLWHEYFGSCFPLSIFLKSLGR